MRFPRYIQQRYMMPSLFRLVDPWFAAKSSMSGCFLPSHVWMCPLKPPKKGFPNRARLLHGRYNLTVPGSMTPHPGNWRYFCMWFINSVYQYLGN